MLQGGANQAKFSKTVFEKISRRPMIVVFVLLSLGVFACDLLPPTIPWHLVLLTTLLFLSIVLAISRHRACFWTAYAAVFSLGAYQQQTHRHWVSQDRLYQMASDEKSPVALEGIIESTPRWRPNSFKIQGEPTAIALSEDENWSTSFDLSVRSVRDGNQWVSGRFGKMSLTIEGRIRDVFPGDRVQCLLKWERIEPPTNPGQFDYQSKSRQAGIFVTGRADSPEQMLRLKAEQPWRLDRLLSRIVRAGDEAFHRYVPFNQATMASALVLNQREQVEYQMQESLLATGTIHMLAISGMHIDLLAMAIAMSCVLFRLSRGTTVGITITVVLAYTFLCGGNPPVARAAILVVSLGIFNLMGRGADLLNLLGFAASCILIHRPVNWLEVGTQLSFLSVAILILIADDKKRQSRPTRSVDNLLLENASFKSKATHHLLELILDMLRTSMWICVLLMPLILYRMNVISPIAILLNLILWIPMTFGLLTGLLLLAFGTWVPLLGYVLGFVCGSSLWISDVIVRFAETIPGGHFWLPAPSFAWLVIFYTVITASIVFFGFGPKLRTYLLTFSCIWLCFGTIPALDQQVGPWFFSQKPIATGEMKITFIDVGHGTSVLLEMPDGKAWLYDAGKMGDSQRNSLGIASVLWHSKIASIDRLFLSHADSDHFNAIPGLLKRFSVKQLLTTEYLLHSESDSLQKVLESLNSRSIPIHTLVQGDVFDAPVRLAQDSRQDTQVSSQYGFQILHPSPLSRGSLPANHPDQTGHDEESQPRRSSKSKTSSASDNSNSLCLLIEYAGRKILLPGDLESPGTEELINGNQTDIDILMAPHHGSLSKDPKPILAWSSPEWIVISGGPRAKNEKVRSAYQMPNSRLLITATDHAIRFRIDSTGQIKVDHYVHPDWISITSQP